ncbi:unnamed protein product, partial [Hapterophycus canaliculatus]
SCAVCKSTYQDEDEYQLHFCASCERGFHTKCLDRKKPKDRDSPHWVCGECYE